MADLIQLQAIPAPFLPPPPQRGFTYTEQTIIEALPPTPNFPNSIKWSKSEAYWWATLVRTAYRPNGDFSLRALQALKGVSNFAFHPSGSDLTPSWFTGLFADGLVCVVGGTPNNVAALNYVLTHANNLQGGSGWLVNQSWYAAAQPISTAVNDLLPRPDFPVLLIGHSMGGAVAAVVMAQLPATAALFTRALVTFGEPAFGSDGFCPVIAPGNNRRFANIGDPVPFLPPPSIVGYAIATSLPAFRLNPGTYRHCMPAVLLTANGQYVLSNYDEQSPGAWFAAVAAFMSNDPISLESHFAREYVRRAALALGGQRADFLDVWRNFLDLDTLNMNMDFEGV